MDLPPDTYVQVYRNLNRACWSIRLQGKVIGHVSTVTLQDERLPLFSRCLELAR